MDKRKDSVIAYKKVSEKVAGSNPALTTNVIRLTAKNRINEEYYR